MDNSCDLLSDFDTNLVLSQLAERDPETHSSCDLLSDFDTNLVLSQRRKIKQFYTGVVICFQILILT